MTPLAYFRDNDFSNLVFRTIIRFFLKSGSKLVIVANRFRIYGTVELKVEDIRFKCCCLADDFMANDIYYGLDYEINEFRLVKSLIPGADNFVEVGSYTGLYSIFAASCKAKLNVICFEPHPKNHQRIVKNIAINNLTNIIVHPVAVGDKTKTVTFTFPATARLSTIGSVNQNFSQAFHNDRHTEVEVKQFPLTDLLKDVVIGPNDFIKIDVEYYELNVLQGALEILEYRKPLLMVEIILSERLFFYKPEMKGRIDERHALEVESLLGTYGYFAYHILKDGVYRTDSVINNPDTRNYLFAPKKSDQRFIPFEKIREYFS